MIDIETIFAQVLFKNLIDKGIKGVDSFFDKQLANINSKAKKKLKTEEFNFFKENYDLDISESSVITHIKNNLNAAITWSNEINFSTAISSKELKNIFVDIDLYLSPLKTRFDTDEKTDKISSKKFLKEFQKNKIVYGGAGAGKTTLIKKVFNDYLANHNEFDFSFPLVIRFRELDYENHINQKSFGLFKILVDLLGIHIKFPVEYLDAFGFEYYNLLKNTVISFFNESKVLLIADGFDEIPDSKLKSRIEKEFQELSLNLVDSKFILTSRSNDFLLQLTNTNTYEICPLNDRQIKSLIGKWITNRKKSKDLFDKIKDSPYYDTTMRPLTLSHLCAIYERKKTIPPKPRYIYDFVLNLLLEAWDQQRSIVRPSKYADFYIEKKKEFLAHLSYWLSFHLGRNVFSSDDIRKCYNKIHKSHNLPSSQAKKVVTELENHTGIFVQTGYNSYQFSHKSLQEFLTAKYLSASPRLPEVKVLKNLPNETAILMCLSTHPNYYFEVLNKNFKQFDEHFWGVFFNRLIEEKPDFDESPGAIVFFLNNIWHQRDLIFKKAFLKLLESTNLRIGFKEFFKLYDANGTFEECSSYIYNNIKIPLSERNYYPTQIYIDNEVSEIIKNYT
ncbi:NACHT domain-containing protein [Tenacibaculum tangerinum]|uniref:NACHT domain-containing protein n=1 Tax=Tenacibaculum tangerinum TaxID=3038772 RepID=A0ABY8L2W1_9FLAO|nr:NACHT domain-containing protein [Tenacibaculum tangerinum]WGH75772.1 NACHT domain-containing protein [Tenacibaculum tangerinum]